MIKRAFVEWWNGLNRTDIEAVNSLAASEAWYQFEFGKFLQKRFWKTKDWSSELYLEKDKVDITVNGIQIEFKMIWNNKNIWSAVESIIKDGKTIRSSRKGGYLALFMAFSNKHSCEGLPTSYTNTSYGLLLQPLTRKDDFTTLSRKIWVSISSKIKNRLRLRYIPSPMSKYENHRSTCAAVLWKVK